MRRRFDAQRFGWEGVEPSTYADENADAGGRRWRDTARHIIKGSEEPGGAFHVRYFEVGPGGFTSLERHEHIHSVVCVRGEGYALVNAEIVPMRHLDHVFVPANAAHQFVNEGAEPFGFLCIVDAQRDRPRALDADEIARLRRDPALADKLRT